MSYVSTDANDTTNGGGQLYLNGTVGNRIDFNTNGVGVPAFTTRSVGTKIVFYPAIAVASADYAIGLASGSLWSGVPLTTNTFTWYGGTTLAATLTGAGVFTAVGNVTAFSDEKLKDNIEVIQDALYKVTQLKGVTYTRKDIEGNPKQTGIIAQDVQKVLPEAVQDNDGTLSVAYGNLVGLLIESIKELNFKIEILEAKLGN